MSAVTAASFPSENVYQTPNLSSARSPHMSMNGAGPPPKVVPATIDPRPIVVGRKQAMFGGPVTKRVVVMVKFTGVDVWARIQYSR